MSANLNNNNKNNITKGNNNSNNSNTFESKAGGALMDAFYKSFIYIFLFLLFTMNFLAVSLALQCNKHRSLLFKASSALFAFMFGFLYIIINYFMYRVNLKKNPCNICSDAPFPLQREPYVM